MAERDAVHWGPGLYSYLIFHQIAISFNNIQVTGNLGPMTVQTLYGQLILVVEENQVVDENTNSRSVIAHSYDSRLGKD